METLKVPPAQTALDTHNNLIIRKWESGLSIKSIAASIKRSQEHVQSVLDTLKKPKGTFDTRTAGPMF